MGKYQKLRGKVAAFLENPAWQDKIDAFKREFLGDNPEDANILAIAAALDLRKDMKKDHEKQISILNVEIEALSQFLVTAALNTGFEKTTLTNGHTVYLQDTPYPRIVERDKFMEWVKKKKMSHLLQMHVKTLEGIVGEMLLKGEAAPPGVDVYLKTSAKIRGGGNGDDE